MLEPGTKIRSKFLDENGEHINGVVLSSQEGDGTFARGYFIDFERAPMSLFLNEKGLYELYDIVYEPVDESTYEIDEHGQLKFI